MSWRKSVRRLILGLGIAAASLALPALAANGPTSKPATAPAAKKGDVSVFGQLAFLNQFKAAVDSFKLSDDLQKKSDGYFEAARKDLLALHPADAAELRQKAHDVFDHLREDITPLLSNEQKLALANKLQTAGTAVQIEKIKQQLNKPELHLSDDQRTQINAVLDDTMHRLEEIHAEGGKDVKPKVAELLTDMQGKLKKVLAPPAK